VCARTALTLARPVFVAAALAATSACADEPPRPPHALLDGTPAPVVQVALEGVGGPAILTKAVVERRSAGRPRSCLQEWPSGDPSPRSVVRVSVHGTSVTFRDRSGRAVFGCDGAGPREPGRRWCGGAYGTLRQGRLVDPRLDLLCSSADGARVAFAWIQPDPRSRYVVVRQDGFVEAYEVVGDLPVRVATATGIDAAAASASLEVSEHRADGTFVRRSSVVARVAG
jgi:hypothetical protein